MNISKGDIVKYHYPNPLSASNKYFIGIIEYIGDTFITLKDDRNILLKISYKNFHLLEPAIPVFNISFPSTENYYG